MLDGVSLTIDVIFGERNFFIHVIAIPLRKYWNTPEVFINFDGDRKTLLGYESIAHYSISMKKYINALSRNTTS